jgi:hypothetical protein
VLNNQATRAKRGNNRNSGQNLKIRVDRLVMKLRMRKLVRKLRSKKRLGKSWMTQ